MRTSHLTLALAIAAFASPAAFACQFEKGPPRPPEPVFWREAPLVEQLQPGEVVVEVSYVRDAKPYDPSGRDVVIVSCGVEYRIYTIEHVLAGAATERTQVLVPNSSGLALDAPRKIFVGRLMPSPARNRDLVIWPDPDPDLLIFEPRLPPQ